MVHIKIDLSEEYGHPYGPQLIGTTDYGQTRFPFQPAALQITGVLDSDEEPRVVVTGPRILTSGLLSTSTVGLTRMLWEHVLPKHRIEYLERVVRNKEKRLRITEDELRLAREALAGERNRLEDLDARQ